MKLLVRAALAGSILLFLPGLLEQFEAPKAAVVRILGVAALAAVAFAWRSRPRWTALDLAVGAYLAIELVATIFSVSPAISCFGDTKQQEGLLTSLGLAGLYFAASAAGAPVSRGTLVVGLGAAAVASVYAALQALALEPTAWSHIATYERAGVFMRPFGTLGHPNVLGVVTAASAAASASLVISERERRWLWGALAALFLAVTAVTLSRGAWLGAALGVGVTCVLALRARGVAARHAALWIGGAGLALAALLVVIGFGPTLLERWQEMLHPESGSARSRLEIWRIAENAWRAHPWLGVGPDAFELTFQRYQTPEYWRFEWATVPAHAHSVYLHTLATRGLLGAAAGLALLGAGLAAARRALRSAASDRASVVAWIGSSVAMLAAGGFGALGISGAAWLSVAAGSLVAHSRPAEARAPRAAPALSGRARIAAGVAGLVMTALAAAQLIASRSSFEALDWAPRGPGDGDPARALRAAARGPLLTPWDDVPEYYRAQTLARISSAAGSTEPLDAAERAARAAIALEPLRAIDHQCLATVLLTRARASDSTALAGARAAFDQASALAPYNALLWLQLADAEISLGRPEDAIPRIRRTLELYPEAEVAHAMLERALTAARARGGAVPPG